MGVNSDNFSTYPGDNADNVSALEQLIENHDKSGDAHSEQFDNLLKEIKDTGAFYKNAKNEVSLAVTGAKESAQKANTSEEGAKRSAEACDDAAARVARMVSDVEADKQEMSSLKASAENFAKEAEERADGAKASELKAQEQAKAAGEAADVAKNVHPKIIGGVWWVYDAQKGVLVSTGVKAQGPKGAKGDKGDKGDKGNVSLVRLRYESDTGNLYYSSDEVLDEDYKPGQNIADGGEIFNDYDKNIALAKYSKASGHQTSILDKVEISEQEIKYISYAENVLTLSADGEFFDTADLWGFRIENTNTKIQSDVLKVLSSVKNSDGSWSFEIEAPIEALNLGTPNSISILAILNGEETGEYACAEGWGNLVIGRASHVENWNNKSFANYEHIEGTHNIGRASGVHIEGGNNEGRGSFTHLEGCNNVSEEGSNYSHLEGIGNKSKAQNTHLEGYHIISKHPNAHYQGKFNDIEDETEYAHVVGGGTSEANRKNIHTIDWFGNAMFAGNITFSYNGKTYNIGQALEKLESLNLVDGNEVAY